MQIDGFFIFAFICVLYPELTNIFLMWLAWQYLKKFKRYKKPKLDESFLSNKFHNNNDKPP